MKVTIEGDRNDFPSNKVSDPSFIEAMKRSVKIIIRSE